VSTNEPAPDRPPHGTDSGEDDVATLMGPTPETEQTRRERLAALFEQRLDPVMAVLAVVWAAFVFYELAAPVDQRDELRIIGDVVWGLFVVEFVAKLAISGRPLRFLRRRWPSLLFLALPALRALRVVASVRTLRLLPVARVVGSSYRTIGTARSLLGSRLVFLGVTTLAVVVSGAQLLFLLEPGGGAGAGRLGETLLWSANLSLSGTYMFEPATFPGRLVSLFLTGYAIIVFASLAATLGTFFVEQRAEQATVEEATGT
jgi:voltage-gated potassium channel